jgi:hypothetical protein
MSSVSKEVLRAELTYIWHTFYPTLKTSLDNDVFSKLCYAISPVLVGVSPQEIDRVFEEIGALKVKEFSYGGPTERDLVAWIEPPASSSPAFGLYAPAFVEADLPDGLESGSIAIAMLFMAKYGTVVKMFSDRGQLDSFYYETIGEEVGFKRGAGIQFSGYVPEKIAGAWGSGLDCRPFSQVLFALSKMHKVRVVERTRLIWDHSSVPSSVPSGDHGRVVGTGRASGGGRGRGGASGGGRGGRGSDGGSRVVADGGAGSGGGASTGRLDEIFGERRPARHFKRSAFTDPRIRERAIKWQLHATRDVYPDKMEEIIQAYLEYCHKYLIHPPTGTYMGPN